jgi:6-phosphofructokinase 1
MKIAVLTSGGDAPGMNAAIRAVARSGAANGLEVVGVRNGYKGLMEGNFIPLTPRAVGGILQLGGTMLGSARSPEFKEEAGKKRALEALKAAQIDGLVVIGGNGSQSGAAALSAMGFPVVGVASTIDNDLLGTDITIGVETAVNIALEAIDRLKVTASSHRRAFLVEVMGRDCGYLALRAAIAGGAEAVAIPEVPTDPEAIAQTLEEGAARGKTNGLIVVAEGASYNAAALAEWFKTSGEHYGYEMRSTILGHTQRGGAPIASDRILASQLGAEAARCLSQGVHAVLVGTIGGKITHTPLAQIAGKTKAPDLDLLSLAKILAL